MLHNLCVQVLAHFFKFETKFRPTIENCLIDMYRKCEMHINFLMEWMTEVQFENGVLGK